MHGIVVEELALGGEEANSRYTAVLVGINPCGLP